jgi:hypothetical protein
MKVLVPNSFQIIIKQNIIVQIIKLDSLKFKNYKEIQSICRQFTNNKLFKLSKLGIS